MTPPQRSAGPGFPRRTFMIGALVTLSSLVAIRGDDSSQHQMLDQYVQILQSGIESTELELQTLEGDISDLRQEIEDLIRQIETAAEPGAAPAPRAGREEPSEVRFQPPQARAATGVKQTVFIWCESNRVSVLTQTALGETVDQGAERFVEKLLNGDDVTTWRWEPGDGDFDYVYELHEDIGAFSVHPQRKTGAGSVATGELTDFAPFQDAVRGVDPRKTRIYFVVFSDSLDLFRDRLRSDVVESDYKVFWLPFSRDGELTVGGGDSAIFGQ